MKQVLYLNIKFVVPGFHCWPDAPGRFEFLRLPHPHEFHFEVCMDVRHDNREIEAISFRSAVEHTILHRLTEPFNEYAFPSHNNFGTKSCETMAMQLSRILARKYERNVSVTVMEDGNVGGTCITQFEGELNETDSN